MVGSDDYSELALPGGHVGVFVSGKSQGIVGAHVVQWLEARSAGKRAKARAKPATAVAVRRATAKRHAGAQRP